MGIDPNYAPAWEALGQRYNFDSSFGGGGEDSFQKSNRDYEKALALDPNRVMAASNLITNRVERGELPRAYDAATDLVRRQPQSADAHFALSYVLRYAGMLEESTQECNAARRLDPGNFAFRSCAWSFLEMGKTDGAMDFVHLDAGTGMGGVGDSVCVFGRGECRRGAGRGPEYGQSSDLSPRSDGGVHGGSEAG